MIGHAPDCPCDSCRAFFSPWYAVGVLAVFVALTAVTLLLVPP